MSPVSPVIEVRGLSAWYGDHRALEDVSLDVRAGEILGIVGPAGGGKSTFLRCLNRLTDLEPNFRASGSIRYRGLDLSDPRVDVAKLRRRVGMVFAVPVPLPGTIRKNLAFAPGLDSRPGDLGALMERTLRAATLWDEVKDRFDLPAMALSGGQQQRLCLARTLMMEPDVLLLDEPCSGLDPISTAKIEDALEDLKREVTIVLVTNNVMQASRVADRTAFFLQGRLVECGPTPQIFLKPKESVTNEYVSGRFG